MRFDACVKKKDELTESLLRDLQGLQLFAELQFNQVAGLRRRLPNQNTMSKEFCYVAQASLMPLTFNVVLESGRTAATVRRLF
jgi:hypothetical protein